MRRDFKILLAIGHSAVLVDQLKAAAEIVLLAAVDLLIAPRSIGIVNAVAIAAWITRLRIARLCGVTRINRRAVTHLRIHRVVLLVVANAVLIAISRRRSAGLSGAAAVYANGRRVACRAIDALTILITIVSRRSTGVGGFTAAVLVTRRERGHNSYQQNKFNQVLHIVSLENI